MEFFLEYDKLNKENKVRIYTQNIIAINHFKNEAFLFAHCYKNKNNIEAIHHYQFYQHET